MKLRERVAAAIARLKALRAAADVTVFDAGGIVGAGLVGYGAWEIYHPAGYIVLGVLLMAAAWLDGRTNG